MKGPEKFWEEKVIKKEAVSKARGHPGMGPNRGSSKRDGLCLVAEQSKCCILLLPKDLTFVPVSYSLKINLYPYFFQIS